MTTGGDRVWDSGLQPERTSLAWLRLSLALVGLALASLRFTWPMLGAWSLVPTALVAAAAVVLTGRSRRRYLHAHDTLLAGRPHDLPDGRLTATAAVAALLLAATALVVVVG